MKSLILKDLYSLGHNVKSMLLIFLILSVAMIPSTGPQGFIFSATLVCSMMTITTFVFDEASKWNRYAMVLPVSRNDIVRGKYIVLLIVSVSGAFVGFLIGLIGGKVFHTIILGAAVVAELIAFTLVALVVVMIVCGMAIPLVIKFGAERGRILLIGSMVVPFGIGYIVYRILLLFGVVFTEKLLFALICCSPIIALVWDVVMYKISCSIFSKQEV